jgi:hypothetical protein
MKHDPMKNYCHDIQMLGHNKLSCPSLLECSYRDWAATCRSLEMGEGPDEDFGSSLGAFAWQQSLMDAKYTREDTVAAG